MTTTCKSAIDYPSRTEFFYACIYVWISENGVKELALNRSFFFLARGGDIKIKKKVCPLLLSPLVYLSSIAVLSLCFAL